MICIAICDDDEKYAEQTAERIAGLSITHNLDLDTEVYKSGGALLGAAESGRYFDIIFLDIMLGGENGIDLAKELRELLPETLFVFLTGYIDFAVRGYEARAFRYLLKGSSKTEIEKTLLDAVNEVNKAPYFSFSYKQELFRVRKNNILYMESDKRLVIIHTVDREYRFYGRLDDAEELSGFIRIHRSFLVNPQRLVSLTNEAAVLSDGTQLSVSSSYAKSAKKQFMLCI